MNIVKRSPRREALPKAAAIKCQRLILSRGLDTPSKKYLEDGLIVKVA
jgi:hypothetical protein